MADALEVEIKQLYDDWIANPSAVVCARLADRLRLAGRISEALDVASRGLEEWPSNAQINLVCARCRRESGEAAPALELFQKVLAADPLNLIALRAVGEIAFEQERFADAERLLGDYLFENPADPDAEKLLSRAKEMVRQPVPSAPATPETAPRTAESGSVGDATAAPPGDTSVESGQAGTAEAPEPPAEEAGPESPPEDGLEEPQASAAEAPAPEVEAAPAPAPPPDVPLFTPMVALAEPAEPVVRVEEPPPAREESAPAAEQPSEMPPAPSSEDVLAGAFGSGGAAPVDFPGTVDRTTEFEAAPPGSVFPPQAGQQTPAEPVETSAAAPGHDWIRSAAGLDTAPVEDGRPLQDAPGDADAGQPEETQTETFPRTDRMDRIIEAQTPRQAPPVEPAADAVPTPVPPPPPARGEDTVAAPAAPPDRPEPPRPQPHAQRQAMPRREPRSLLDLFSSEERDELGLEQFRQEEQ